MARVGRLPLAAQPCRTFSPVSGAAPRPTCGLPAITVTQCFTARQPDDGDAIVYSAAILNEVPERVVGQVLPARAPEGSRVTNILAVD